MLDKSIPYYNIIMLRKKGKILKEAICPKGFSFEYYKPGDEMAWAEIETSVDEFDNIASALEYFKNNYIPYMDELQKRTIFIQNEKKEKVGTFTMWWDQDVPSVHWVGVKPEYQGLGLGKAIVFKGIEQSVNLLGDIDIYLHTQTWSYKAVGVYKEAGFEILKSGSFGDYKNDYEKAKIILDKVCRK